MELDREKIEAAIVREAAASIISDDDLYERVKKDIDARVDRLFASRVDAKITEAIDGAIRGGFDQTYVKRDSFGRPVGEPTTISAELERLIGGYWNARVGSDGKPTESTYSSVTRAEWLMAKICGEDFQKEVKQHAVNVAGQLKDGLRRELGETVNRILAELFNVRSAGDQEANRSDRSVIHPTAAAKAKA